MDYKWNYLMTPEAEPMFQVICDSINNHGCKDVLDIGCGYSKISELLPFAVCGIDIDKDAIDYCNEKYTGTYLISDAIGLNPKQFSGKKFDCLVLSGLLYYFKGEWYPGTTMTKYLRQLIKDFDPKLIVVAEPQPRPEYNGPSYVEFLDTFKPKATNLDLDIRMGKRVVYEIKL